MIKVTAAALLVLIGSGLASAQVSPPAASTPVVASKGKMLVASDGARLAVVYRVVSDGPQIILDGRMVTIPASTISMVDGKLSTSLTKGEVIALK